MTHSGGKPHTNIGDRGQRYEVRGVMRDGTVEVFGWTNEPKGGTLLEGAKLWPRYKTAFVIDRGAENGSV